MAAPCGRRLRSRVVFVAPAARLSELELALCILHVLLLRRGCIPRDEESGQVPTGGRDVKDFGNLRLGWVWPDQIEAQSVGQSIANLSGRHGVRSVTQHNPRPSSVWEYYVRSNVEHSPCLYNDNIVLIVPTDERTLLAKLARASKTGLISVSSAAKATGATHSAAALSLGRLARRGWVQRARRGLYLVLPLETEPGQTSTVEDPWVLAREVFAPCYIGGWSAAEHWGLTEQLFRSTLVVTAAAVRATNVEILSHPFRIFRVPRARLASGVAPVWRGAERVNVSGLERTLIDCLRNPELCGGTRHLVDMLHAYRESPKHDFERLVAIGRQAASGAAWKRLGYLAELLWPKETRLVDAARRHVTTGNARLDPAVRRPGKLVTRWRLLVNVDLDNFTTPVTRP